jgi:hypothetical protein
MNEQIERRRAERRASDEELSPEYLAVLEVCGGDIRAADRARLAQRRHAQGDVQPPEGDDSKARKATLPVPDRASEPAPVAADRRRPKTV